MGPGARSDRRVQVVVTIEKVVFCGRTRKPLSKKLNPLWWVQNDDEQTIDEAPWYLPDRSRWWRWLCWNVFRNPLQNFRAYVVGVQDRNYTVIGKVPAETVQRDDLNPPEKGWQWCFLRLSWWQWLPFFSYSGKRITGYFGWQPSGFFGTKLVVRFKQ